MTDCMLCTNDTTCTQCGTASFLDTGNKNCITNCLSFDSWGIIFRIIVLKKLNI